MKRLFLLCLLFLIFNSLHAENKFRFVIGPTVSYFLDAENTKPKVGLAIGVRKDFPLHRKLALSTGANFASRGTILEDRTIAPYATQPTDAFHQDIHGMVGYLEFPLIIQYALSLTRKVKMAPLFGAIITLRLRDLTRFERKEPFNIYVPGQTNLSDYDYNFGSGSSFSNNSLLKLPPTFGFRIISERLEFEVRYTVDGQSVYYFDSLSEVHDRMHSIYFLIHF